MTGTQTATFDINCDMGESLGNWVMGSDEEIMPHVTTANVACGYHGGDPVTMERTVALVPDGDGKGYWLVASDGGIFAFDALFHGSTGNLALNKPVSGIVPADAGYLMVAEDGGIFSFGDVEFHGSLGANPPARPVVAVALMP